MQCDVRVIIDTLTIESHELAGGADRVLHYCARFRQLAPNVGSDMQMPVKGIQFPAEARSDVSHRGIKTMLYMN